VRYDLEEINRIVSQAMPLGYIQLGTLNYAFTPDS